MDSLVQNVKIEIDGVKIMDLTGSGRAVIKHIGIAEKDCKVCQLLRPIHDSPTENALFQQLYGTKHKYRSGQKKYICLIEQRQVDSLTDEYLDLIKRTREIRL